MATITSTAAPSVLPPIPLTTVFAPPSSCFQGLTFSLFVRSNASPDTDSYVYQLRGVETDCFPASYDYMRLGSALYYSPGICPKGYIIACSPDISGKIPPTAPGEEAHQCCPSNYQCDNYWGCTSSLEEKVTITAVVDNNVIRTPATFTLSDKYNLYGYPLSTASAKPIQIRFRSLEDSSILLLLPSATDSGVRPGTKSTPPSSPWHPTTTPDATTAIFRASSTPDPDPGTKSSSGGLSQSDKIQIAMGTTFPAIAVLLSIYGLWRSRNNRRNNNNVRAAAGG